MSEQSTILETREQIIRRTLDGFAVVAACYAATTKEQVDALLHHTEMVRRAATLIEEHATSGYFTVPSIERDVLGDDEEERNFFVAMIEESNGPQIRAHGRRRERDGSHTQYNLSIPIVHNHFGRNSYDSSRPLLAEVWHETNQVNEIKKFTPFITSSGDDKDPQAVPAALVPFMRDLADAVC